MGHNFLWMDNERGYECERCGEWGGDEFGYPFSDRDECQNERNFLLTNATCVDKFASR